MNNITTFKTCSKTIVTFCTLYFYCIADFSLSLSERVIVWYYSGCFTQAKGPLKSYAQNILPVTLTERVQRF